MKKLKIIPPNEGEEVVEVEYNNAVDDLGFEVLQKYVGGSIEVITAVVGGKIVNGIVNEEGLLFDLPENVNWHKHVDSLDDNVEIDAMTGTAMVDGFIVWNGSHLVGHVVLLEEQLPSDW